MDKLKLMPKEFKTMTFGQYMNFYETMGRIRKGELNERSIQLPAYRDSILNPQSNVNGYYDDKDADFLFGQINQPSFNADGNKFMKDLSKKYLKKYNAIQGGVPNAPFVTDRNKWTGLAIKRLIKLAEEGGYDHIAFSPGKVQYERWGDRYPFLIDYYDKIIPQVASKLPKSLGVTTSKVNIKIPKDNLDTGGIDLNNQETFAINITPKTKETLRGGMPLFSTVGGMVGLGALGSMPSTQDGGT